MKNFRERPKILQKKEQKEIAKEIKEPPLTFSFPLNKRRREAIEMIYRPEKIKVEKILELLESEDFVEKRIGVELVPKVKEFSRDSAEKTLSILERMENKEDYSNIREKIFEAKIRTLLKINEGKALSVIVNTLESFGNLYLKGIGIKLLAEFGERALPILESLPKGLKESETEEILLTKLKILASKKPKEAISLLRENIEFINDFSEIPIQLFNFKKELLPFLKELAESNYWKFRLNTAKVISYFISEKEGISLLKKLSKDKEPSIRVEIIKSLSNCQNPEKVFPLIEELIKKEKIYSSLSFKDIVKIFFFTLKSGENGKELLKEIKKNQKNENIQKAIELAFKINKQRKYYLALPKSLYATPFAEEMKETIFSLWKIKEKLERKFKDGFLGFIIGGSLEKGYFEPKSDIDYVIVGKEKRIEKIENEFRDSLESLHLKPCDRSHISILENGKLNVEDLESYLFSGLFFGAKKRLLEIQKKFLENITEKEWDKIRKKIMREELRIFKTEERFFMNEKEITKISQAISLLKTPPSFKETLEILKEKLKTKNKSLNF